jgi:hypothetical protein
MAETETDEVYGMTGIERRKWDTLAILAYIVTIMVGLSVLTPYFYVIPEKNSNLITQGQTTLYAGWMLILAFYYKSRGNNPVDAETISVQARTIKDAQTTLSAAAGVVPGQVNLTPGDQVKVQAVDDAHPIKS